MAILTRRVVLQGAVSAVVLTGVSLSQSRPALAAPIGVGVLIPGSKSDKGWMGEFNKTIHSRMMDRIRSRGF